MNHHLCNLNMRITQSEINFIRSIPEPALRIILRIPKSVKYYSETWVYLF